ncbi:MAG: hypothetical protein RII27_06995, partial [Alphaproteobacteria bacterium]
MRRSDYLWLVLLLAGVMLGLAQRDGRDAPSLSATHDDERLLPGGLATLTGLTLSNAGGVLIVERTGAGWRARLHAGQDTSHRHGEIHGHGHEHEHE